MNNLILVTGANGTVGKEVVRELLKVNANFKISTSKKNTSNVYLNFEDPKSIRPAFQGITKLF